MKKKIVGCFLAFTIVKAGLAFAGEFTIGEIDPVIEDLRVRIEAAIGVAHPLHVYAGDASTSWFSPFSFRNLETRDRADLKSYAATLESEWIKYTSGWLASSGLEGIGLVEDLSVSGQLRCAGVDGRTLFLDLRPICQQTDHDYVRRVIHHEFYHRVEATHFGDLYYHDPQWIALNPPGWSYDGGTGSDAYSWAPDHCPDYFHPYPGFATCYSTSAPEEDKAEVYSLIITDSGRRQLNQWIISDSVLAKKVAYLKHFIVTVDPAMDRVINAP